MTYEKPEVRLVLPADGAVKGSSKSMSNTDSNRPTIAAYEADE